MNKLQKIQNTYHAEISEFATRCSDHEGLNSSSVSRWMSQFIKADLNLAISMLRKIHYYDAASIRSRCKQLIKMVRDEFPSQKPRDFVWVPIGSAGSGAEVLARAIRAFDREVPSSQLKQKSDLASMKAGTAKTIVLFDDLSATGQTISEWWDSMSTLILPLDMKVVFAILAITSAARSKISHISEHVLAVDELGEEHNVLSEACLDFTSAEKARILFYCQKTKCSEQFVTGYRKSALLLAFKHGCPNNSLPVIWYDAADRWKALFKRRAI